MRHPAQSRTAARNAQVAYTNYVNYFAEKNNLHPVLKFLLANNLLNFLTQPDFVAYNFYHRKDLPTNLLWQKVWKVQGVSWTIKSQADYDTAVSEDLLPIFEGFRP